MSENDAATPEEQVKPTPPQQAEAAPAPTSAGTDEWKARADGLFKLNEQLTLKNRNLEAELAAKSSQVEQLKLQLSEKEIEKSVLVGERDKHLGAVVEEKTKMETELARLRGMELKLKVANKLGHPELMQISSHIPVMDNEEAMEAVMKDFLGFSQSRVEKEREMLLAGITPAYGSAVQPAVLPTSDKDWSAYVESFDLGSPERKEAMDQWFSAAHQKK